MTEAELLAALPLPEEAPRSLALDDDAACELAFRLRALALIEGDIVTHTPARLGRDPRHILRARLTERGARHLRNLEESNHA